MRIECELTIKTKTRLETLCEPCESDIEPITREQVRAALEEGRQLVQQVRRYGLRGAWGPRGGGRRYR